MIETKIVNRLIDTKSKEEHSLYIQWVSGTHQRERMKDCLLRCCLETWMADIFGNVTFGLSSPDAHYSDNFY